MSFLFRLQFHINFDIPLNPSHEIKSYRNYFERVNKQSIQNGTKRQNQKTTLEPILQKPKSNERKINRILNIRPKFIKLVSSHVIEMYLKIIESLVQNCARIHIKCVPRES